MTNQTDKFTYFNDTPYSLSYKKSKSVKQNDTFELDHTIKLENIEFWIGSKWKKLIHTVKVDSSNGNIYLIEECTHSSKSLLNGLPSINKRLF